jgi:hypothetical protein
MQSLVWINTILLLCLLLIVGILVYKVSKMEVEQAAARVRSQVRQGAIARSLSTKASPRVDSRVRTVVRDSNDIPPTGRMSQALSWKKP